MKKVTKRLKRERGKKNKPRLASREAEIVARSAQLKFLRNLETRNQTQIKESTDKLAALKQSAIELKYLANTERLVVLKRELANS